MSLSEEYKARFQWLTNALLIVALGTMGLAMILQLFLATHSAGDFLVTIGVVAVIVSTPLRLLALAVMYRAQGDSRAALSALILVLALGAGALVKVFLL